MKKSVRDRRTFLLIMQDTNSPMDEIPQFKELREQIQNMKAMLNAGPLLSVLGMKKNDILKKIVELEKIEKQFEEMASIPDAFNDLFSKRGWIIYDQMNHEVAKAAVKKAESGDINGAEDDLVEYYNYENVKWLLRTMWGVKAFRLRMDLAEKALEDYQAERYHACVPVVLALIDGTITEVNASMGAKQRGFAAKDVDLSAWNSLAGHSKGLNSLVKIFQTGRYRTIDEEITIPYRNGILHGMDLGYGNKIVAAKTWAALFAVREWAIKAEKKLLEEQPKEPEPSFPEIITKIIETEGFKEQIKAWTPRKIAVGVDVPIHGEVGEYLEGSPERKLVEFLSYWKAGNFGYMARSVSKLFQEESANKMANQIRELYKGRKIERFELQKIEDEAAAITTIHIKIWENQDGEDTNHVVIARMINEDEKGNSAVHGTTGSEWHLVWYGLNHYADNDN